MCDYAVGLSRQLYGLTIASERPDHRLHETWLPLGPIGVITAFNFPVAVWSWNAALALVCGDPVVWKPSDKTPLTALACQAVFASTCARYTPTTGHALPEGLLQVCVGACEHGRLDGDGHAPASYQCHGELSHGAPGSAESGGAPGPEPARTRRQQWGHCE